MRHFISLDDWTEREIMELLRLAEAYREQSFILSEQLFAANLFFEPSTRTKMSFIVAQRKLGLDVLDFNEEFSSTQKGESLYDTAKTFEAIGASLLVIRHRDDCWIEKLKGNLAIPIINAGAGKKEHPTQCLLDLLTIYQEFQTFKGINVVIAGDISHSRVAKSNAYTLQKMGAHVYLTAPEGCKDRSLPFPYIAMDEAVEIADTLMLLRIQHERHKVAYDVTTSYLDKYGLTKDRERNMRPHAIILHPAPINRNVEIDTDLVECKRSRIFKQMNNGVYARMAIIISVLTEWGAIHETVDQKYQTPFTYGGAS
ncbi:aspartate carbamoyltransferase catalytic subunit [Roseburia sp. 1XD42-34]|nr:aspartate carbamoyltransferase catalytic subunit [Roseburia sp. 1XD42-34]RKI81274.1 aspartate carbamoyltransferase catalytic subunit [Clostridium sp. 1xD42-85]